MTYSDFKVACGLVLSHSRQRPTRLLLTIFATVAAAAIVVAVVSGYDSLVNKFAEFSGDLMGRYEYLLVPAVPDKDKANPFGPMAQPPLAKSAIEAIQADPAVAAVEPIFQTRPRINKVGAVDEPKVRVPGKFNFGKKGGAKKADDDVPAEKDPADLAVADRDAAPGGPPNFFNRAGTSLIGTDASEPPYKIIEGRWFDARRPELFEGVISRGAAQQLKVALGDDVAVAGGKGESLQIKIVGIVEQRKNLPTVKAVVGLPPSKGQPLTRGPAAAALYVPMAVAERSAGGAARFHFAGIVLRGGASADEFRTRWHDNLAKQTPAIELQSLADIEAQLNDSYTSDTVKAQAYSATGISLLAALFIIFTTLSMGVDERIRQLAVLRAACFTKSQVALMIAFEGLLLGLIGWAGGLLAGAGVLALVARLRPDFFPVGSSLGMWCVVLSGVCALGGSLLASILPAWKATRVSPLETMATRSTGEGAISWKVTLAGLVLIAVNPLLVFVVPMPDTARYAVSAAVGCGLMAIGFIMVAPLFIVATERLLGPIVARLMGLDPLFLASQLSSNVWRTLGTTVALTLGLGLFVAMQVWGYSMLHPFFPGDWVPDVGFAVAGGIPDSQWSDIKKIPGVVADQCVPMVAEQTKFAEDVTGAKVRTSASRQDNCVMVGVDPETALGGDRPVFRFRFVAGSRDEALAKMKAGGRYCLVPDHFQRESGLGVGDKFGVVVPNSSGKVVSYEIAGVVSMDGWHWISKIGLRNRGGGRSAGLMFSPMADVRRDFSLGNANFYWMNLDGTAEAEDVKTALQQIAKDNADPRAGAGKQGRFGGGFGGGGFGGFGGARSGVRMQTTASVREQITERADGIMWLLSRLPLVTLLVTSLGVMNTIVSSVRARRWDIGVLRAIGVTRFAIFRVILAEALLVGLVACVLSLAFGALAGYCGTGLTRYVNVRGGLYVPLVVPWAKVAVGFAATLGLCLLAALWPAVTTGRMQPLRLLQVGRSAI